MGRPGAHPGAGLVSAVHPVEVVTTAQAIAWIAEFIGDADQHHDRLTEADRLAGDGDFGDNLRSALRRVADGIRQRPPATVGAVFTEVAEGFLATGGTSGPLFGRYFTEFARAATADLSVSGLADAAEAAVTAVRRLGRAEVGHKTMVDAMVPAAEALTAASSAGEGPRTALAGAALAAQRGAEATRDLLASRGRASYVGQHAVGVLDPGALTVALFFAAGARCLGTEETG
jgi:dihydroxyacetone kinase-like protein